MSRQIASARDRLDNLFTKNAAIDDDEINAHWARYLCVRVAGFIEIVIKEIIKDYSNRTASPAVSRYVEKTTQNMTNLRAEKLKQLLNSFNVEWQQSWDKLLSEQQKSAFDSIFANRNLIAHGGDSGITYVRVKEYYAQVKQGLNFVEDIVKRQ